MKNFFGYIRVSTARQGEHGVSLPEQRDAIARYAQRNELDIARWFEERQTAAKRGRPIFNQMMKLLRQGKAVGVVIHKIDRSARNLKDWADLGELIDAGIEVRFVNESLDLRSRGGRLTADIQAVVAADYIRNLREESRKGFYGRIKQGFLPLPAPIGYLDRGAATAKEIDPVRGPLVRRAFELYATGEHNLWSLLAELDRSGLRNRRAGRLTMNGLSNILNNPFYIGLIHLRRTHETFPGNQKPLIPKSLFDRVQDVLQGRLRKKFQKHDFAFRRLLACKNCGRSLISSRQKGHVYYRCQTRTCPTTCHREEAVIDQLKGLLDEVALSHEDLTYLDSKAAAIRGDSAASQAGQIEALKLQLAQVAARFDRLTDAYLDGALDKAAFEERKTRLLGERRGIEDEIVRIEADPEATGRALLKYLELAGTAKIQYESAITAEKREMVMELTSNRVVDGKNVGMTLSWPFSVMADELKFADSVVQRDEPRTSVLDRLLKRLLECVRPAADTVLEWRGDSERRAA